MARLQKHQLEAYRAAQLAGTEDSFVMPPPLPRKKRNNEEWQIERAFTEWWRSAAPGLKVWHGLLFAVPNGSQLGDFATERAIRAKMLKMAGVVAGVSDRFLAVAHGQWHGMFLEFKVPQRRKEKNGGLSDAQIEFTTYALANRYQCRVAYSWQEGRDAVLDYLSEK